VYVLKSLRKKSYEKQGPDAMQAVTDAVTTESATTTPKRTPVSGWRQWYSEHRGRGAFEVGVMFVLIQLGLITWFLLDRRGLAYLDKGNLGVMSQSIGYLGLLTIGSGIVMMVGEIDLSIGANFGLCAIVFLTLYQHGNSAFLCIAASIATGTVIGIANALLINFTHIPSLIATLGMLGVLWAAQIWYAGGDNPQAPRVKEFDPTFRKLVAGNMRFGIRAQFGWLLAVTVIVWVIIHRHRAGNHIFAVGGNEQAAKSISINPKRVRILAFVLLGSLAGIAAVFISVQGSTMLPGNTNDYNLDAIAGAVIGGTAVRGGKGSVLGMLLGAILLKSFKTVVFLSPVFPAFYEKLFTGLMLVLFAIINQYFERKAE
jgi:simple sugar transport system permease protein